MASWDGHPGLFAVACFLVYRKRSSRGPGFWEAGVFPLLTPASWDPALEQQALCGPWSLSPPRLLPAAQLGPTTGSGASPPLLTPRPLELHLGLEGLAYKGAELPHVTQEGTEGENHTSGLKYCLKYK